MWMWKKNKYREIEIKKDGLLENGDNEGVVGLFVFFKQKKEVKSEI